MINPIREISGGIASLFRLLDRRSKWGMAGLIALSFLNMLIEMAAVVTFIVLLFHFSDPGFTVYDNPATRFLADTFPDWQFDIPKLIILIFVAYLAKNLFRVLEFYAREQVGERTASRYSKELFDCYLHAPFLHHLQRSSGELIDTVWHTSDSCLRASLSQFMALVSDGLIAAGIFLVLLQSSPGITFFLGLGLGLVSLGLLAAMHRHYGTIGQRFRQCHVDAFNTLQQAMAGIREVKLFQREPAFLQRFRRHRDRLRLLNIHGGVYGFIPTIVLELIFISSFAVLGLYAYWNVEREWLLPVIGTYAFCGARLLPAANRIVAAGNALRGHGPVLRFLERELVNARAPRPAEEPAPAAPRAVSPPFHIAVRDLGFAYPGGDGWQLVGISCAFEPGKSYAILGESGSGKTTLLHILAGLLPPGDGAVEINGRPLQEVRTAWQAGVGYVAQEPFVLNDSIQANIILGPDEPDPERLARALEHAQLAAWVDSLPEGPRTRVGENGRRISGGQRQRLAIARALYKNPEILLLDEPTSALDTVTERAMEEALLRLRGGISRVIVTHRLSTARRCDQILFLARGRLLARGSYATLVEQSPDFRKFAEGSA